MGRRHGLSLSVGGDGGKRRKWLPLSLSLSLPSPLSRGEVVMMGRRKRLRWLYFTTILVRIRNSRLCRLYHSKLLPPLEWSSTLWHCLQKLKPLLSQMAWNVVDTAVGPCKHAMQCGQGPAKGDRDGLQGAGSSSNGPYLALCVRSLHPYHMGGQDALPFCLAFVAGSATRKTPNRPAAGAQLSILPRTQKDRERQTDREREREHRGPPKGIFKAIKEATEREREREREKESIVVLQKEFSGTAEEARENSSVPGAHKPNCPVVYNPHNAMSLYGSIQGHAVPVLKKKTSLYSVLGSLPILPLSSSLGLQPPGQLT
ncbi:uncharacterized protein LOC113463548 isoform X2 [Phoenix dactylifera]|uniref:Uncharacterized protein LOC113463548 isoform X2 n=1 Tax=Phoenix dactylifera TaxID=42345 RepID=A0A8B8ZLK5_PHODC|nr:uncharacterized protein LOC113463548 isoform X2 [Phoenix dactylifera]